LRYRLGGVSEPPRRVARPLFPRHRHPQGGDVAQQANRGAGIRFFNELALTLHPSPHQELGSSHRLSYGQAAAAANELEYSDGHRCQIRQSLSHRVFRRACESAGLPVAIFLGGCSQYVHAAAGAGAASAGFASAGSADHGAGIRHRRPPCGFQGGDSHLRRGALAGGKQRRAGSGFRSADACADQKSMKLYSHRSNRRSDGYGRRHWRYPRFPPSRGGQPECPPRFVANLGGELSQSEPSDGTDHGPHQQGNLNPASTAVGTFLQPFSLSNWLWAAARAGAQSVA